MGCFWCLYILICFMVIETESSINLALRKPANQSSIYVNPYGDVEPWAADKAVDGNTVTKEPISLYNTCSITAVNVNFTEVWWYVDLKQYSRIMFVKIFYRRVSIARLKGYSLFISNNSWTEDRVVCFKDNGTSELPVNQTLTCSMTGRFVTVYNRRNIPTPGDYDTYALLELCEVEVLGCPFGKYGDLNCNHNCSDGCINGDCYPDSGECVYACLDQKCNECVSGRYGSSCEFFCSNGCVQKNCTKQDGYCNAGCKPNWNGQKCDACVDGVYGPECNQTCYVGCNKTSCTKTSVACFCKNGWAGNKCDKCVSGRYGSNCEFFCSNGCVEKNCTKQGGYCYAGCKPNWNGQKCDACISGVYGTRCYQKCSVGCNQTCAKADGACVCNDRWSGNKCDKCVSGRYGSSCEFFCSNGCVEKNCTKQDGYCYVGCKPRWKGQKCDACVDGFYGTECDQNCSADCNHACSKADGTCVCHVGWAGNKCDTCVDGLYGTKCDQHCSVGCNQTCAKSDGACICNVGWAGNKCDKCVSGRYGSSCEYFCSNGCVEKNCTKQDGYCYAGCKPYWKGQKCDVCVDGVYGAECDQNCSVGCNRISCVKSDGACVCNVGWAGNKCDKCASGRYGTNCEFSCSNGCAQTNCTKQDGYCNGGCKPKWKGLKCDACVDGGYGTKCDQNCSFGCKQIACAKTDGSCVCNAGWTGNKCDKCVSGRYGSNCEFFCSNGCVEKNCTKQDGYCYAGCKHKWKGQKCDACVNGVHGTECDQNCSVGCNQTCWKADGTCVCNFGWSGNKCDKCVSGRYGSNCEFFCSTGCVEKNCTKQDGYCYVGCKPYWSGQKCDACVDSVYGFDCDQNCSVGCNQTCAKVDGDCECNVGWAGNKCDRCNTGLYGDMCELECSPGCLDNTCNKQEGSCQCKAGWTGLTCQFCVDGLYGRLCEQKCSSGCDGTSCNRTDGVCKCKTEWSGTTCQDCAEGHYGSFCNQKCSLGCNGTSCNKTDGACDCLIGWSGTVCEVSALNSDGKGFDSTGVAIGAVVVVLLIIAGIIIVFAIRRRKLCQTLGNKPNESGNQQTYDTLDPQTDTENEYMEIDSGSSGNMFLAQTKLESETIYENTTLSEDVHMSTVIKLSDLEDIISAYRSNGEFKRQFQSLPIGAKYSQDAANMEINKSKNRTQLVLPYDHSRVVLECSCDSDPSYINASYIQGVDQDDIYISTQGPKKDTVEDFWRMIWQEKSGKIVMLTNLIENGKIKCQKYWPEYNKVTVGDFEISLESQKEYLLYSIRQMKLTHSKKNENRAIYHFHFKSWSENSLADPEQVVLLHWKFLELPTEQPGPTVIHCSDGVDRSGTFIALDAMNKYGNEHGHVDVYEYAKSMRECRSNMIPTLEQYIFIHKALLEHIQHVSTCMSKADFIKLMHNRGQRIMHEFEKLRKRTPKYDKSSFKSGLDITNRTKNRTQIILPVERFKAVLVSQEMPRSNYINAIIIPSCQEDVGFIVTQYPLADTVNDFWCMVNDYDSRTVVVLDELPHFEKDLKWYPTSDDEFEFGKVTLYNSDFILDGDIKTSEMKLINMANGSQREIKVFHYLKWNNGDYAPFSTDFHKLVTHVADMKKKGRTGPVTVVCTDGAKCCGLFCVLYILIDELRNNDEFDIYQTVRALQQRRPEFISSFEQYQYCYEAIQRYIETENDD